MEGQKYIYIGTDSILGEIPSRTSKGENGQRTHKELKEGIVRGLNLSLLIGMCFFIGRVFIFKEIAPFATALFAVMVYRQRGGLLPFLSTLGGMISISPGAYILKYAGEMILIFFILRAFKGLRPGRKRLVLALLTTIVVISGNLLYKSLYLGGILTYDYLISGLEGGITLALVYVFDNVFWVISDIRKRRILSSEEMISLGLFAALLIVGFWDISLLSLSLKNVLSIFFILLAAFIGGGGLGAAMGILMGLVLTMASGPDPILIADLGLCGLMAGTFKDLGKIPAGIAFLLSNAFTAFYVSGSALVILPFREILLGAGMLAVIPKKALTFMGQFVDYSILRYNRQKNYINRIKELTVGRLLNFSKVFDELSAAFGRISENDLRGQDDVARLFDIISNQVCIDCPLYGSCWERNFSETYANMFDLISAMESRKDDERSDAKRKFSKNCIHTSKLIDTLERVYGLYRSNLKWKVKIEECRQLTAQQLEGVSKVVGQLSEEINIDINFLKDAEDIISVELDKAGIRAKEVLVMEKPGGDLEVSIHKKAYRGHRECIRKIEAIVGKALGKKMTVSQNPCFGKGKEDCIVKLLEAPIFRVSTGIARKAGNPGEVSGDSYSFSGLDHGQYMLALSDGMGTGYKAMEESSIAISLLENFLAAGFDLDTTIRSINSTLLLRSRDEIFATVDLCLLDLLSGRARFVKIGAVSTYIKRGNHVEVIKGSSLPMGILDSIQAETMDRKLLDEDMVIMITDGVGDNSKMGERAEEWLISVIASINSKNPQEIADYIMNAVFETDRNVIPFTRPGSINSSSNSTGPDPTSLKDDMTVMVTRVWKSPTDNFIRY